MIDTNVTLSRWPFRRLPDDETSRLVARLKKLGATQAWAGTFDGVFHRDIAAANHRLVTECREHGQGMLLPFGSVNPQLPDWQDDLRRCHEEHGMLGIRLHPNYHGYKLDDLAFARLLALATERKLVVQLVVTLEDERTQHPMARAAHVDLAPLAEIIRSVRGLRIVLLNSFRSIRIEQAEKLAAAGRVWFDIAMLEGLGGVDRLVRGVGVERVLFGSHSPFFTFDSALLKLSESPLGGVHRLAIFEHNAHHVLTE